MGETSPLDSLREWMSYNPTLGPRWIVEQPSRRYYKVSLLWGLQRVEAEGVDLVDTVAAALDQFQETTAARTLNRYAEESRALQSNTDMGVLGEEETLP